MQVEDTVLPPDAFSEQDVFVFALLLGSAALRDTNKTRILYILLEFLRATVIPTTKCQRQ